MLSKHLIELLEKSTIFDSHFPYVKNEEAGPVYKSTFPTLKFCNNLSNYLEGASH